MKKAILAVASVMMFVGCSKSSSPGPAHGQPPAQQKDKAVVAEPASESQFPNTTDVGSEMSSSNLSPNEWVVTRPGGLLEGGISLQNGQLDRQYLNSSGKVYSVSETLYHEGKFPEGYAVGLEVVPAKADLLANATAWEWAIETVQNPNGSENQLRIYKKILYSKDGTAYEVDSQVFNFGDKIEINDQDSGVRILCNIPKE